MFQNKKSYESESYDELHKRDQEFQGDYLHNWLDQAHRIGQIFPEDLLCDRASISEKKGRMKILNSAGKCTRIPKRSLREYSLSNSFAGIQKLLAFR